MATQYEEYRTNSTISSGRRKVLVIFNIFRHRQIDFFCMES